MVGPTIQDDIFSLLLRFRNYQYVLTGDIEKMYRQFEVRKEDRKYQRILWRGPSGSIKTYELNTVTFGLSPAPFLAIRCLHQLANDEMANYPRAAQIIKRDLYVDDLLTGATTFDDALHLRNEITALLQRGGLNLRQWASNEPLLLKGLPSGSINLKLQSRQDQTIKTLGVHWNSERDIIIYTVSPIARNGRVTKRTVLSHIARIFDPLGLLGPVVTHAKIIMQRLWRENLDWDKSVPAELDTEWDNYASQLSLLNDLQFNRGIVPPQTREIQLHGFCDASEKAYGACIYIRTISCDSIVSTTLLCSKSRVAPLKGGQETGKLAAEIHDTSPIEKIPPMTIPKLELCGATLLAKLYSTVRQALNIEINKTVFWCDNTAVLNWINSSPCQLLTFVANRVAIIQEKTKSCYWRYVKSHDNPADLISRGQLPSAYVSDLQWKNGPAWLIQDESMWPQLGVPTIEQLPGLRKVKCLATPIQSDILTLYSSIVKLRRFIAYAQRFKLPRKHQTHLTCDELESANVTVVKLTQAAIFFNELRDLREEGRVNPKSKLISLSPFLDDLGIMRIGGRLANSKLSFTAKHPIILPRSHYVTSMIIRYEHIANYHTGVQTTLYSLRKKYWIIDGRNQVRKTIRGCIVCARANPPSTNYIMGNLPGVRITEARPFLNVGVDYCGPFFIKEKKNRNRGSVKVYVAGFVCLAVKAVHLELVSDLTTEAFIAALKRFIARRGKCANIYSDNGTNFVGANNELNEIVKHLRSETHKEKTFKFCVDNGIKWHFIPPQSPNFGGIWEAAVKSFQHHLRRVVGQQLLTFEQFYTFITEVEAILNSRPLTPISSDPNDPIVLSPGHYLIGNSLTSLPEVNYTNTPYNRLSLWQHIQKMKQDFWARWHKECLNELNIRHRWSQGSHSIREGSLVLIKEDNLPPLRWLMGRVIETRPGSDGVVRVVRIKTSKGVIERNVRKLAPLPLPIESDRDSEK